MINKALDAMFDDLLIKISKDFVKEKKKIKRGRGLSPGAVKRLYSRRVHEVSIKDAAHQVMEQAYIANARQIMYQAGPLIQKLTDKIWKNDSLFTQKLLPDFMAEYPGKTAWKDNGCLISRRETERQSIPRRSSVC